jgi:hypothetical protein
VGYTALSRHREEARFYVNRGDIEVDLDLPAPDLVVLGLEHLLSRSAAKQLALESLQGRDTADLTSERDELRMSFDGFPPSPMQVDQLAEAVDGAWRSLTAANECVELLQQQRADTKPLRFRERGRLGELITTAEGQRDACGERWHAASAEHRGAAGQLDTWLAAHSDDASRLVAIEHELQARTGLDQTAIGRQQAVSHDLPWPAPQRRGIDRGISL